MTGAQDALGASVDQTEPDNRNRCTVKKQQVDAGKSREAAMTTRQHNVNKGQLEFPCFDGTCCMWTKHSRGQSAVKRHRCTGMPVFCSKRDPHGDILCQMDVESGRGYPLMEEPGLASYETGAEVSRNRYSYETGAGEQDVAQS